MSKEKINQLDKDIRQAEIDYQKFLKDMDNQIAAAAQRRSEAITALQDERDALALAEKLKEYPKALVEGHKTCSICGQLMRPFRVARGGKEQKIWACANGNLSEAHDLVNVG
jgi:hypothetical protein